jgi:hypothetical protein
VFRLGKALRPNYLKEVKDFRTLKSEKKDDQDLHLHSLSNHAGWKILNEFINDLKDGLDMINQLKIDSGASIEEVGQNSIVITMTKSYLKLIQDKVNDARAEVEPDGGSTT